MYLILFFVKKLTIRKVLNALYIGFSYVFSALTKKVIRKGFPFSISIEPTNICNLKCPQCPTGNNSLNRIKSQMDFNLYKSIIQQSKNYTLNLFLYFQGEPFLTDKIFEMIDYADKNNIFTVTSTNGHFLDKVNCKRIIDSRLDKIIISLDGTNQTNYEKYRKGGNFERVFEGIKNLAEEKKINKSQRPYIEVQFLVFKHNENFISEFKKMIKPLGVNKFVFKSAQVYNFENDEIFIPENIKFSRYKKNNGKWIIKKRIKNRCFRLWNSIVITNTGEVLPCCFDKNADFSFGNIKNEKLNEIIVSENFKKFAKQVFWEREKIEICKNCTE